MADKFSLEAERAVLGGCLLDPSRIGKVEEKVSGADFIQPLHKAVWRAIKEMSTDGKGIDLMTVTDALEGDTAYAQGGGMAYVAEMIRETPSSTNVLMYADIVKDRSERRKLDSVLADLGQLNNDSKINFHDLVDRAQSMVTGLVGNGEQHVGEVGDWLQGFLERFADKADGKIDPMGTTTGIKELDEKTFGFHDDQLWILMAESGMGKTMVAVCWMLACSLSGRPVVMFQQEMGRDALMNRAIASHGQLDLNDIRRPHPGLGEEFWSKFSASALVMKSAPMVIDDRPGMTPSQIARSARRWRDHFKAKGYAKAPVFFIDHAGIVEPDDKRMPREQQMADIANQSKRLAKSLSTSVVLLAQTNRDSVKRQDKRPIVTDLRESAALQHNADVIIGAYRDVVHNKDSQMADAMELIVLKQRDGETGTVYAACNPRKSWVGDMSADRMAGILEERNQAAQQKSSAFGGIL